MQKESADDSDRVDDAVDPRVQVSAAARRVCIARIGGERGGVPTILTLSVVGEKRISPRAVKSRGKESRGATRSNDDFHRASSSSVRDASSQFPSPTSPTFFPFPPPARPPVRSPTHAHTHESSNVPDS